MRIFECGDVVELISKNERMCVRQYKDGKVVCDWFDSNNDIHQESFNSDDLILSDYKYLLGLQRKINRIKNDNTGS